VLALDRYITLDEEAISSPNLCNRFSEVDLQRIGRHVHGGYTRDDNSRSRWKRRTQAAMDLAMQVQKDKSFPWPGCANIAFPLVTIAAMQSHSRLYPAIIQGTNVVKCRVIGADPVGDKTKRALRISTHMSWQVLEEDQSWEEQKDRLLINLPIVGCAFTKTYYCSDRGHKVDETVLAKDLVLDYWAKSVESCPRKTHLIPFFRNQIHSNAKRGIFRDVSKEAWYSQPATPAAVDEKRDNRMGLSVPQADETTPYLCLEQHVDLDLDNDGYAEPYIITVEDASQCVLRIVTGFDSASDIERNNKGEVVFIRRMEYFTKYDFVPSPDGGVYGVGFGVLLGPLNETTNTLINQLVDAGTMQTTKGGFLGRGAKIRGGQVTMSPFQWHRVDSSGDDLRKNIVPHEPGEPSTVLFQLLGLLINYVNRIAGTTDPMVGENPGQNTTAETMRTMIQEGMRIYSAIFKRVWRSMKEEFKKGYIVNGIYMPARKSFGQGQVALREDYLGNPDEVAPAADPNITSEQMQLAQAQLLKQAAATTAGYNSEEVEKRYLRALKVDSIDQVYPGVAATGTPKDVRVQVAELKAQVETARLQAEQARFAVEMMEEMRMNSAEISKIMAEIATMRETVVGDWEDRKIGLLNAVLGAMKTKNDLLIKRIDAIVKIMELKNEQAASPDGGNVRRLAGASSNRSASGGPGLEAAAA
jgi:chaperonin GroES